MDGSFCIFCPIKNNCKRRCIFSLSENSVKQPESKVTSYMIMVSEDMRGF